MRLGCLLVFSLLSSNFLTSSLNADELTTPSLKLVDQFREIQKDYETKLKQYQSDLDKAMTDDEIVALRKNQPDAATAVAKIRKLVQTDPGNELVIEMATFALKIAPIIQGDLFEPLMTHHIKNPKIVAICREITVVLEPKGLPLLEKVLDLNPSPEAQAFACFGIASLLKEKRDRGDKMAENEKMKVEKKIEDHFALCANKYADFQLEDGKTIGEYSKRELFEIRSLGIGKTVPEVKGLNLDDQEEKLSDYRGKVVVIDVWTSWCRPCKEVIPIERRLVEKYKKQPFTMISISADDNKNDLQEFLKTEKMPWVHWWVGIDSGVVKDWNIKVFPTFYVLDAKGVIRYKNIQGKNLESAVEKLMAEIK